MPETGPPAFCGGFGYIYLYNEITLRIKILNANLVIIKILDICIIYITLNKCMIKWPYECAVMDLHASVPQSNFWQTHRKYIHRYMQQYNSIWNIKTTHPKLWSRISFCPSVWSVNLLYPVTWCGCINLRLAMSASWINPVVDLATLCVCVCQSLRNCLANSVNMTPWCLAKL